MRLAAEGSDLGMARFAPDGQTVVYSADWGPTRDVYLMRIGDPESRLLFSNTDLYAVSDKGELAVMPGTWTRRPNLLARVPLAGGAPREVVEDVAWANADWAPEGQELAIIRSVGGKNRLEFPIGNVLHETDAAIRCPRISPDGKTIAFFEENHAVKTIQSDGTGASVLSSGWGVIEGVPCWVGGGKEIWFTAGRSGESSALFRVDHGRLRLIARVPGNLELYDVSPSGQVLVGHHTRTIVLKWGRTGEGEAEQDLSWLDWSWGVDLSADGRSILFTEIGEGGGADSAIYLRATDGSSAKRLGDGNALALSPDGKWVLGTKDARLFLVPTGPGQTRFLTGPVFSGVDAGDWSPDGTQVVFSAGEKGKGRRLYIQPVDGGPPRPISPEGVTLRRFGDSVSPDGRLVIGLPVSEQVTLHPEQRGEPRLYRLDGGEARSIPGLNQGEFPVGWSARGDAIYVHRRFLSQPGDVQLLDIATGQRRVWRKILSSSGGVDRLLIARDGSSYAYNSRRITSELELAEGLK
jgi:Tol biopolymer transport system component